MQIPADNPMTPEKVALGRQLFFDKRLSVDGTRSCYSCHVCEKGLTDGLPKAVGALNKALPRSSPTLVEHWLSQGILLGRAQRIAREAGHGGLDRREYGCQSRRDCRETKRDIGL